MNIEDRVRAATRARADLVTGHRPLQLPAGEPACARRRQRDRRWLGWGAPLAAAALVIVLAVALVVIRQAGGPPPASGTPSSSTSGTPAPAMASVPRYYVALANTGSEPDPTHTKAVVGDDRTGATVAVIAPSSAQHFYGVTGASDDRTFVMMNVSTTTPQTTFYLLRISPGSAQPARLTKLPIKPIAAFVIGLALSPDGSKLAVMWQSATPNVKYEPTYLSVYSVSSGAVLDSYLTHAENDNVVGQGPNGESLSWVDGDRGLDFQWTVIAVQPPKPAKPVPFYYLTLRRINLSTADHDLLADSRQLMTLPTGSVATKAANATLCASSLIASDGTFVCGSAGSGYAPGQDACAVVPPTYTTYWAATGRQLAVLYRYQGQPCVSGQALVLWTDSGGRHVLALILRQQKNKPLGTGSLFGLVTGGHFITLPELAVGTGYPGDPADSAGNIAF